MTKLKIESDSPEVTVLVFDNSDYDAMYKYKRMMTVEDVYSCIFEIEQKCRQWRKYPPDNWDEKKCDMAWDLQEEICDIISDYKLEDFN